jgi:hypothetical protein
VGSRAGRETGSKRASREAGAENNRKTEQTEREREQAERERERRQRQGHRGRASAHMSLGDLRLVDLDAVWRQSLENPWSPARGCQLINSQGGVRVRSPRRAAGLGPCSTAPPGARGQGRRQRCVRPSSRTRPSQTKRRSGAGGRGPRWEGTGSPRASSATIGWTCGQWHKDRLHDYGVLMPDLGAEGLGAARRVVVEHIPDAAARPVQKGGEEQCWTGGGGGT